MATYFAKPGSAVAEAAAPEEGRALAHESGGEGPNERVEPHNEEEEVGDQDEQKEQPLGGGREREIFTVMEGGRGGVLFSEKEKPRVHCEREHGQREDFEEIEARRGEGPHLRREQDEESEAQTQK